MLPCPYPSSAGIGRTGVLILMETALCLVEANQPIFPLDIVRQMREQRLGMIQTAVGPCLSSCPQTHTHISLRSLESVSIRL